VQESSGRYFASLLHSDQEDINPHL
jgi:hypothetical protein